MKKQLEVCTLEEFDWVKKIPSCIVINSPTTTMLQCKIDETRTYNCFNDGRGETAKNGLPDKTYNICAAIKDINQIDEIFISLVREKVMNMLIVYETMLDEMKLDGILDNEQCEELKFKDAKEFMQCMSVKCEEKKSL